MFFVKLSAWLLLAVIAFVAAAWLGAVLFLGFSGAEPLSHARPWTLYSYAYWHGANPKIDAWLYLSVKGVATSPFPTITCARRFFFALTTWRSRHLLDNFNLDCGSQKLLFSETGRLARAQSRRERQADFNLGGRELRQYQVSSGLSSGRTDQFLEKS